MSSDFQCTLNDKHKQHNVLVHFLSSCIHLCFQALTLDCDFIHYDTDTLLILLSCSDTNTHLSKSSSSVNLSERKMRLLVKAASLEYFFNSKSYL